MEQSVHSQLLYMREDVIQSLGWMGDGAPAITKAGEELFAD